MKKLLLVCLLLVTNSAWAEWVFVARNDDSVYFDPTTIRKDGNYRKVWEITNLPERGPNGEASFQYRNEYDCKDERSRILSLISYTERMAKGKDIYRDNEMSNWSDIPPRSFSAEMLKIVCAK